MTMARIMVPVMLLGENELVELDGGVSRLDTTGSRANNARLEEKSHLRGMSAGVAGKL